MRALKQADRDKLLVHLHHGRVPGDPPVVFRKKSRIIAVEMHDDFTVETDRGVMAGEPGDWLVTNHPDDDPGSDLWVISADRMASTYVEDDEPIAPEPAPEPASKLLQ